MSERYSTTIDIGRCALFIVVNCGLLVHLIYYKKIFSDAHKDRDDNKFISGFLFVIGFIWLFVTSIAVDGTYRSWNSSYVVDFLLFKNSNIGYAMNYSRAMGYTIIVLGVTFFVAYLYGTVTKRKRKMRKYKVKEIERDVKTCDLDRDIPRGNDKKS